MSTSRKKRLSIFAFTILLAWYAIFGWRGVSVPKYNKGRCYSPNHAFYIERYQTLWESLGVRYGSDLGTARLYDRSNKLLYEGETYIHDEFGPEWTSGVQYDPVKVPKVFFMDNGVAHWSFDLPESPGEGVPNNNCYPTKVE